MSETFIAVPVENPVEITVTVKTPQGEKKNISHIGGTLMSVSNPEDIIAYEAQKAAKRSFRTVMMKEVERVYPELDQRARGLIWRATINGMKSITVKSAEEIAEAKAIRERLQKTLWYSVWWSVLQFIHNTRYVKDKIGNAVLSFWLKLEPGKEHWAASMGVPKENR